MALVETPVLEPQWLGVRFLQNGSEQNKGGQGWHAIGKPVVLTERPDLEEEALCAQSLAHLGWPVSAFFPGKSRWVSFPSLSCLSPKEWAPHSLPVTSVSCCLCLVTTG